MRARRTILMVLAAIVAVAAMIFAFDRHIARTGLDLALHPDVRSKIDQSLDDQRKLRELDPENERDYHRRFDELRTLSRRLDVLELSREAVARRYRVLFLALIAVAIVATVVSFLLIQRRNEQRLRILREDLERLARGERPRGDHGPRADLIGRIGQMVERAGNAMEDGRRRINELRHLSVWQESMRRQVHEIRGPLTAARLEAGRVEELAGHGSTPALRDAAENVRAEIERISRLAKDMSSFASLGPTNPEPTRIGEFVHAFADTFRDAWPGLTIDVEATEDLIINLDRDLLRRVLVNLTENSVSVAKEPARVSIELERVEQKASLIHRDRGPGIRSEIRERLFEPYVTTRRNEGGTGLGLAISKKIMLDMGGDLRLRSTSDAGTVFEIDLPVRRDEA